MWTLFFQREREREDRGCVEGERDARGGCDFKGNCYVVHSLCIVGVSIYRIYQGWLTDFFSFNSADIFYIRSIWTADKPFLWACPPRWHPPAPGVPYHIRVREEGGTRHVRARRPTGTARRPSGERPWRRCSGPSLSNGRAAPAAAGDGNARGVFVRLGEQSRGAPVDNRFTRCQRPSASGQGEQRGFTGEST
jgi:hypothetical protein